tara:strand:+ start:3026 stop:3154 length:129 start_codon:yes stop_codon:yes gene_type:complete
MYDSILADEDATHAVDIEIAAFWSPDEDVIFFRDYDFTFMDK